MNMVRLFEFDFISSESLDEIVSKVTNYDLDDLRKLPLLITPNVDQIVQLGRGEFSSLKNYLTNAFLILPDGQPIVWFSRIKFGRKGLKKRLTGSDFFPVFWENIKKTSSKTFIVIPTEEVGEYLKSENPDNIEYYAPPYFDINDNQKMEEVINYVLKILKVERFSYLLVGLGFPKQELLAKAIISKLQSEEREVPFILLLGASFEFYCKLKPRAPLWMRKLGLEFFHRFLTEPRRMFKRYFIDDLRFFNIAVRELKRPHK